VRALTIHPEVALTIDDSQWPYKVLLIRGIASIEAVDGIAPEYAAAAIRYFGEEQGRAWMEQMSSMAAQTARIPVRPTWVGLLDYEERLPSTIN